MDNFDRDVSIEHDALDLEWVRQPQIYMKWAEKAAIADDTARQKKENLEFVAAQRDKHYRSTLPKVTENLVMASIKGDPEYQKALQKYNDALYNADICKFVIRALDHKKTALENLVRMWIGSYFAGPREPRDLKTEIGVQNAVEEDYRKKAREKMNKNKEKK
jgi:hypothetical protein